MPLSYTQCFKNKIIGIIPGYSQINRVTDNWTCDLDTALMDNERVITADYCTVDLAFSVVHYHGSIESSHSYASVLIIIEIHSFYPTYFFNESSHSIEFVAN